MIGRSLEVTNQPLMSTPVLISRAYLWTNAASRMAMQTSRNGTSLVNVYPCNTLGSALVAVVADFQGVGRSSDSPPPKRLAAARASGDEPFE